MKRGSEGRLTPGKENVRYGDELEDRVVVVLEMNVYHGSTRDRRREYVVEDVERRDGGTTSDLFWIVSKRADDQRVQHLQYSGARGRGAIPMDGIKVGDEVQAAFPGLQTAFVHERNQVGRVVEVA